MLNCRKCGRHVQKYHKNKKDNSNKNNKNGENRCTSKWTSNAPKIASIHRTHFICKHIFVPISYSRTRKPVKQQWKHLCRSTICDSKWEQFHNIRYLWLISALTCFCNREKWSIYFIRPIWSCCGMRNDKSGTKEDYDDNAHCKLQKILIAKRNL